MEAGGKEYGGRKTSSMTRTTKVHGASLRIPEKTGKADPPVHRKKERTPDQIIPMDEDDCKDF